MLGRGDRRRARAGEHDDDVLDRLLDDLERVEQRRTGNDGRPMLVVVKDGDPHRLAERLLDVEAIRCANVLEVDAADGRLEQLAELYDIIGTLRSNFDIEDIDVRELLEEISFALHHGFAGERSDIAETQDGSAIRDDRDEVAFGGVGIREVRIAFDLEAGLRDAW